MYKKRMFFSDSRFLSWLRHGVFYAFLACLFLVPESAFAGTSLIDNFNLAPFVPMVLDALMTVAVGCYNFFVGGGTGPIYILIFLFLAISIALYLLKMYFPANWVSFFGFSGGGDMYKGAVPAFNISETVLKKVLRAVVASLILLQVRPTFITDILINPFLQFGSIYSSSVVSNLNNIGITPPDVSCPTRIIEQGWLNEDSCNYLITPVYDLSYANNQVIKKGFEFLNSGIRSLLPSLISHNNGNAFMDVLTGVLLIMTFVSCNVFMALLIIQGIFNFGLSLILYPFRVLTWTVKPKSSEEWYNIWPVFSGITDALKQLVITMIACSFMLIINIAVVRSMFGGNNIIHSTAAGGNAYTNLPMVGNTAVGFGEHFMLCLSSVLTFYLMLEIFKITRDQIMLYAGKGTDDLYKKVKGDTNNAIKDIKKMLDLRKQFKETKKALS